MNLIVNGADERDDCARDQRLQTDEKQTGSSGMRLSCTLMTVGMADGGDAVAVGGVAILAQLVKVKIGFSYGFLVYIIL